jgi:hypothetical protein
MARSIGEGIATGLESGVRLAMDINRQQSLDARQRNQDAILAEDRQRLYDRQDHADQLAALNEAEGVLKNEGAALQAQGDKADPVAMQSLTERWGKVQQAKRQRVKDLTGYDLLGEQEQAKVDLADIQKSPDVSALRPDQILRAVAVGTNHDASYFIRKNGQPSEFEQAAAAFADGADSGNKETMLQGLNAMMAPSLKRGVGQKSPHGGTIVGKKIVDLHPDPNAPEDDPHVIPMLRVYVNNGKPEASGDEMRARRAMTDGAPQGATGYYDAPVTENRSTDPNDKVKSISINKGMDFIGKHMEVVELLNRPDVLAKLQQATPNDFDSAQYQDALLKYQSVIGQMGLAKPKSTSIHAIGPNGLAVVTTDQTGRSTVQRLEGAPRTQKRSIIDVAVEEAAKNGTNVADEYAKLKKGERRGTFMEEARQIADDEGRDIDEVLAEMQKYGITKQPRAGIGGKQGPLGADGRPLKEREQDRKELKDRADQAEKDVDNARADLTEFNKRFPFGPPAKGSPDRKEYDAKLVKLEAAADEAKKVAKQRKDELNNPKAAAEPKKPAAKSGAPVLKYDKSGKRVN